MDNTFSTLMGLRAQEETIDFVSGYTTLMGEVIKKSAVPVTLAVGLLAQAGPIAEYEVDLKTRSYAEILKEHQNGKQDNSLPEPESVPGMVVGLTLGASNTATSGTLVVVQHPMKATLVQIASQDDEHLGYQIIYEAVNPAPVTKFF